MNLDLDRSQNGMSTPSGKRRRGRRGRQQVPFGDLTDYKFFGYRDDICIAVPHPGDDRPNADYDVFRVVERVGRGPGAQVILEPFVGEFDHSELVVLTRYEFRLGMNTVGIYPAEDDAALFKIGSNQQVLPP